MTGNVEKCQEIKGELAEIRCKNKLISLQLESDTLSYETAILSRMGLLLDLIDVCDKIDVLEAICSD